MPWQFAFDGEVPVPRLGIFEVTALCGDRERQAVRRVSARIVGTSESDVRRWLEGRIAAKEDRVADAEAGDEPAAARADDGLIVHPVGKAGARLELAPTD